MPSLLSQEPRNRLAKDRKKLGTTDQGPLHRLARSRLAYEETWRPSHAGSYPKVGFDALYVFFTGHRTRGRTPLLSALFLIPDWD